MSETIKNNFRRTVTSDKVYRYACRKHRARKVWKRCVGRSPERIARFSSANALNLNTPVSSETSSLKINLQCPFGGKRPQKQCNSILLTIVVFFLNYHGRVVHVFFNVLVNVHQSVHQSRRPNQKPNVPPQVRQHFLKVKVYSMTSTIYRTYILVEQTIISLKSCL